MDKEVDKLPMKDLDKNNGYLPDVEMRKAKRTSPTLKEALLGFTQNTTLHGVRFIFMDHVSIIRRLLWTALFVTCAVLMSVQIIERIVYYYRHPVTVNVHVNFNKTLAFPALTLCNQNAFRASAATNQNLYRLLEDMYAGDNNLDLAKLQVHNASTLRLDQVFRSTAHRKEDFIVDCEWQDEPCGVENFTEILTDHGVCYNFNADLDSSLVVTSTGSEYGLKLTLNVEQYEYMPGPHNAAGIKILLHDQKEFPKVAELGLAVPTGSHTFVGIQLLRIENLPKPHGACRSEQSPYYQHYSPDACQLACMTEALAGLCHCRHMYMPHINDTPPICTLEQYLTCYKRNIGAVKRAVRDNCECPVPCDFLIYDPTISFASTSAYATDRLLATTSTDSLQESYLHAREVTARMDKFKFQHFTQLEEMMRVRYEDLKKVINGGVTDSLLTQKESLTSIHDRVQAVWDKKKYLLEWQKYHVEKNFIRPRAAMEERTLFYLVLGFQEYSYQVEARIQQISNPPENLTFSENVRTAVYIDVINLLNGRMDLAERANDNFTQLYNAYLNGTPIFRYKFHDEPRNDNIYITPKPLLYQSLFHNDYAIKYSSRVGSDILNFRSALLKYVELANASYFDNVTDPEAIHLANVEFLWRGRQFYNSKSIFYSESLEYPLNVLSAKLDAFDRLWRNFEGHFLFMFDKIQLLLDNLDFLRQDILSRLEGSISTAQTYINNGNVSKMQVAEILTSEDIHNGISELKNFFRDIRSRGQNVYDGWSALIQSTNDIYSVVLEDENMEEYYNYKNMTEYLRMYDDVAKEIEQMYIDYRDGYDFRFLLGNLDSLFLRSLDDMMKDMGKYLDNSDLDIDFIKKNFLQLDVFYKEKSYEQITQQAAYDIFALLCDIGGSMGLFVGASVMTICEILDLGLHHSLHRLVRGVRVS